MNIDMKTFAIIVSFIGLIVTGAMGYGSLKTEVSTLKQRVNERADTSDRVAQDIMEMKTDIATLLERTKP